MIVTLGEGRDSKGIEMKIAFNKEKKETTVIVWHGELVKTEAFQGNRFGFFLGDSIKALAIADKLGDAIIEELKL